MRRWLVLIVALTVCLLPTLWTLLAALGIQPNAVVKPLTWSGPASLAAYVQIAEEQTFLVQQIVTSIAVSAGATALAVVAGFLAAYALARSALRGRRWMVHSLLVLASLPAIAYLIALRQLFLYLRLFDTLHGISLALAALYAPLAAYILYGYLARTPADLEDAARLDGADLGRLLWRVALPTQMPGIAATAVIVFVLSYHQFFVPLLLTDRRVRMLSVALRDFFTLEREFEWRIAAAVIILMLIPALALVLATRRFLESFSLADIVVEDPS